VILSGLQGFVPRLGVLAARASRGCRLYLQTADGVELPASGRGRRYWIVSRGLCRFFRVPLLAGADRARQLDAIALEVKRLSPFEQTGWHLHLGFGVAGVWLWDQQATQAVGTAIGVEVTRMRVLPEPALRPAESEAVRLVESLEGVEGQYWHDGGLSASRWWSRIPEEHAWVLFQRGASVPSDRISADVPIPLRLGWLDRPWTKTRNSRPFDLSRLDMRLVAAVVAMAVLGAYGYQGARYLHVTENARALAREVQERSATIEPILSARTRALDNLTAIRALHELDPFPSQLALMARAAEILPRDKSRFDDWLYDHGQLELSIAADQPLDVVRLVRSLEDSGYFRGVAADRAGNNNTVRLRGSVISR
jgi:hypothetical protein